ncbi:hypothetical protein E4T44_00636 [Aureobasidium sp. EXF-8845]|nr:hypothetical protein E4T44_00636 [Aureobasidium sp. EXF-8845]KAI4857934.1 hypothetical protein E4T45_00554 [Aureobasidium sp. EXF-8846]
MRQPHTPGDQKRKRNRKAKFGEIRFDAPLNQEQAVDPWRPLVRTKFLINDKLYPYSEVTRYICREDRPDNSWLDELNKFHALPRRVQIFSSPLSETDQFELTPASSHTTDHEVKIPSRQSSAAPGNYARWAGLMDRAIRDCFLELVTLKENATISPILSYPDEQLVPAKFFFNIIKYYEGAHENNHFVRDGTGELTSYVSAKSTTNVRNFYKCCITAIDLIERGRPVEGFALVSEALLLIEEVLEERDIKLIDTICDVSAALLTKCWDRVYDLLQDKICGMVELRALRNGEEHQPWAQIFASWRKLPKTQALEFMRRGWLCGHDQFESITPGYAWEGVNISCSSNLSLRMGEHTTQLHQDIMSAWFSVPEPSALISMREQFACGQVLYHQRNFREALGTMESIVWRCAAAREQGEQMWIALEIEALEVSARCKYAISKRHPYNTDVSMAMALLETAIARSESVWGITSATTIALKHTLWLWLLDADRSDDADILWKTIAAAVSKSGSEVSGLGVALNSDG